MLLDPYVLVVVLFAVTVNWLILRRAYRRIREKQLPRTVMQPHPRAVARPAEIETLVEPCVTRTESSPLNQLFRVPADDEAAALERMNEMVQEAVSDAEAHTFMHEKLVAKYARPPTPPPSRQVMRRRVVSER